MGKKLEVLKKTNYANIKAFNKCVEKREKARHDNTCSFVYTREIRNMTSAPILRNAKFIHLHILK